MCRQVLSEPKIVANYSNQDCHCRLRLLWHILQSAALLAKYIGLVALASVRQEWGLLRVKLPQVDDHETAGHLTKTSVFRHAAVGRNDALQGARASSA